MQQNPFYFGIGIFFYMPDLVSDSLNSEPPPPFHWKVWGAGYGFHPLNFQVLSQSTVVRDT